MKKSHKCSGRSYLEGDYPCKHMIDPLPTPASNLHLQTADLEAVFSEERERLRHFIAIRMRGRGEEAVDDVLQEVALVAHRAVPGSVKAEGQHAWLRGVAARKVQDYWRKVQRQDRLKDQFETEANPSTPPTPLDWVVQGEHEDLISASLARLSPEHRELLELKYIQGKSYAGIAAALDLTEKTIEYRLTLARNALRHLIGVPHYE